MVVVEGVHVLHHVKGREIVWEGEWTGKYVQGELSGSHFIRTKKQSFTFGFERVSCDVIFCNAKEDGVAVELVELRLEERYREGACKRGYALAQRRTMSASHPRLIYNYCIMD